MHYVGDTHVRCGRVRGVSSCGNRHNKLATIRLHVQRMKMVSCRHRARIKSKNYFTKMTTMTTTSRYLFAIDAAAASTISNASFPFTEMTRFIVCREICPVNEWARESEGEHDKTFHNNNDNKCVVLRNSHRLFPWPVLASFLFFFAIFASTTSSSFASVALCVF